MAKHGIQREPVEPISWRSIAIQLSGDRIYERQPSVPRKAKTSGTDQTKNRWESADTVQVNTTQDERTNGNLQLTDLPWPQRHRKSSAQKARR